MSEVIVCGFPCDFGGVSNKCCEELVRRGGLEGVRLHVAAPGVLVGLALSEGAMHASDRSIRISY